MSHSAQKRIYPLAPVGEAPIPMFAPHAKFHKRHYGLFMSFALLVLMPFLASALYFFIIATPQFASRAGFALHQESSPTAETSGLSLFSGVLPDRHGDQLYAFLQSQALLAHLLDHSDLADQMSAHWPQDPLYAIPHDAPIERKMRLWRRLFQIDYDPQTRLFALEVRGFSADMAQRLITLVLQKSQEMIDALNATARQEATHTAHKDLRAAQEVLREIRTQIARFRNKIGAIDPLTDAANRAGISRGLEQQLTAALLEEDLLRDTAPANDARHQQAVRKIAALRAQIESAAILNTSPDIINTYEALQTDLSFAQDSYIAARAALEVAQKEAETRKIYIAAHIPPTRAETPQYPQAVINTALIGGFAFLIWSILALVYYSIRERR